MDATFGHDAKTWWGERPREPSKKNPKRRKAPDNRLKTPDEPPDNPLNRRQKGLCLMPNGV